MLAINGTVVAPFPKPTGRGNCIEQSVIAGGIVTTPQIVPEMHYTTDENGQLCVFYDHWLVCPPTEQSELVCTLLYSTANGVKLGERPTEVCPTTGEPIEPVEPTPCKTTRCEFGKPSVEVKVTIAELTAKSTGIGNGIISFVDIDARAENKQSLSVEINGNTTPMPPRESFSWGDGTSEADDFCLTIPAGQTAVISWTYVPA